MSRESAVSKFAGGSALAPSRDSMANTAPSQRVASTTPAVSAPPKEEGPASIVVPAEATSNNPTPEQKEELSSDRFAHLAKKEAKLQKEREALKTERDAMLKSKQQYEDVEKRFRQFEELKAKDPIEAMKLAGFSDSDIFNFYVKAEEAKKTADTPEARGAAAAEGKIKEFEKKQADQAAKEKADSDKVIISRFKAGISKTVVSDKDKYEYCNYNGPLAEELIYNTVEAILQDSGEIISAQEAADLVEKFYEDQDKAMNTLKKRGYKPPQESDSTQEPTPAPSKTLTNRVAPTVASTPIPKKETHEQKKQRLIEQIKQTGIRR